MRCQFALRIFFCCFDSWDAICADLAANNPACANCIEGGGGGGGNNNLCPTCDNPCGDAQGFATPPTVDEVVAGCESAPFVPELFSGSLNTFCYSFSATAPSVDFQVIITSDCGAGNVTNFSWTLYNAACGAPIQSGTLASLTFSPLTIGNNYVFCYTFNVPFGCSHEIHCPYFVGASVDPCPTAEISYSETEYCGAENVTYPVNLVGSGAFGGGNFSAIPAGLTINPVTGEINPGTSSAGNYTISYTIPATGSCDEVVATTVVNIEEVSVPEFDSFGPYCTGTVIPSLPGISINGISGSWSPAINNNSTTTYTFTPDVGQCAEIVTVQIEIDDEIEPVFDVVGPFCAGEPIPDLPNQSNNGLTGSWSPEIDNTTTTTYTFTPDDGQCGLAATIEIHVDEIISPEFDVIESYCLGAVIPGLPGTSNNGVTGTWSPAINNNTTTTYTFSPDDGQCSTSASIEITIDQPIIPEFEPQGPYCAGSLVPDLPETSFNGISGTWSPALNNNTTTIYTFTPDTDQCAVSVELTIEIEEEIEPTFDAVGPFCEGANITALPTTSVNNISGTWNPEIDNSTTTTYTFTSNDGECAVSTTLEILIEPEITPVFDFVVEYCFGTNIPELPATSTNGISGNWAPALDNTATTTYTFSPDVGQCGTEITSTITIIEEEITPIPVQACNEYTWGLNGETYTESGEHAVLLESAQGCDSTVVLSLTINPSQSSVTEQTACENYLWNGQLYSESGVYVSETLTPAGCSSMDSLILNILPIIEPLVVSVEICDGEEYLIGNTLQSTSGTYAEFYTAANGCDSIVQVQLTVLPKPQVQYSATPNVATVFDDVIQFFNVGSAVDSMVWDFGAYGTFESENPIVSFGQNPGRFSFCLTVWSEEGCTNQNCFTYVVLDEFNVYIPNAFTPNEDGINDLFFVEGTGLDPDDFHLRIFNRWGELVFESKDMTEKWNGESPKATHYIQNEVYVYHLVVGAKNSMEKREYKGTVTAIR